MASKAHNKMVNESYGSAEIYGSVFNDTVCLGNIDIRDQLDDLNQVFDEKEL